MESLLKIGVVNVVATANIGHPIDLPRLSNDKEKLYTPEIDSEFRRSVVERFPTLNVDILFKSGSAFVVWDQVFDNGFNYDRLFRAIRNVTYSGLGFQGLLLSVVGLDIPPEVSESEKQYLDHYI